MAMHSYDLADWAEYGGFGSWLSSVLKCGSTSCDRADPNAVAQQMPTTDQVESNVALIVAQQMQLVCRAPITPEIAKATAKKYLVAYNAYTTSQSSSAVLSAVVDQVLNELMSTNQFVAIAGCGTPATNTAAPVIAANDSATSTANALGIPGLSPTLITYGALGVGAFLLLKSLRK